jgi:HAD superfamily hydrolase (TIGR01450 family)
VRILVDLDGVIWRGSHIIPGVKDVFNLLSKDGVEVHFFTNNSYLTQRQLLIKLKVAGVKATKINVHSSAVVAGQFLKGVKKAYVIGGPGIKEALRINKIEISDKDPVQAVVVGLDLKLSYQKLTKATYFINNGAFFVATNSDPAYPLENNQLAPGAGAIVAALKTATGQAPVVLGKPHRPTISFLKKIGHFDLVIGDRLSTDFKLAQALNSKFVLVLSGVTDKKEIALKGLGKKFIVIKSVKNLPSTLRNIS